MKKRRDVWGLKIAHQKGDSTGEEEGEMEEDGRLGSGQILLHVL